jgi:hypothetical protein
VETIFRRAHLVTPFSQRLLESSVADPSRKSAAEMTGELFREVGVLALVFYPIREGIGGEFSGQAAIFFIVGAVIVWIIGASIERWRKT